MASKRSDDRPAEQELERLYLQPPERFTRTRDELARSLRERGARAAAQEVKGLRRPSMPAWLVNQLALREPKALDELLNAGRRLREAEDAMLGGNADAEDLRAAARDESEAVDNLVALARGIASGEGVKASRAALDRAAETLRAAGADPELAERIRAGRLDKEARSATIGASTRAPSTARET